MLKDQELDELLWKKRKHALVFGEEEESAEMPSEDEIL